MSFYPKQPCDVAAMMEELIRLSFPGINTKQDFDDAILLVDQFSQLIFWIDEERPRFEELRDDLEDTLKTVKKVRGYHG